MVLHRLSCEGFRNLEALSLSFSPELNILFGNNAQGKTNLMEAIWMLTGVKSFRGSPESQMVRFGREAARVTAEFYGGNREQTIRLQFGKQRAASLNEVPLESFSELAGAMCCVAFSPVHLSLVRGGPEERRRFLDILMGQLSPRMIAVFYEYKRMLGQRNALIKDIPRHAQLLDMLDVYDEMLAKQGAVIAYERRRLVERLSRAAAAVYHELSNGRERLSVALKSCYGEDTADSKKALVEAGLSALRKARGDDLKAGYSTVGCHRDDLTLLIDGHSARAYGSQGQQRSVLLSLKLGEAAVLRERWEEEPIILLDDVLSELDPLRQAFILSRLEGRQVFITCCEPAVLEGVGGGRSFFVQNGQVSARD